MTTGEALYRKLLVMIGAAECLFLVANANVSYSLNGGTLTVTAPSTLAHKSLRLLWNKTDNGDESEVASWTNSLDFVSCVPSSGGVFSVDLDACGITNGQPCRIATFVRYNMLATLKTQDGAYVDSGVKDSDVYGVRFGFYGNECSTNDWGGFFGTRRVDNDGGFSLGMSGTFFTEWCWWWQGSKASGSKRPTVSATEINEIAFTNGVLSVNGTKFTTVSSGSVGTSGRLIRIGKGYWDYVLYGKFSHVSCDNEDGRRILDYIPARRVSDGKAGFYDRATSTFVASSGTGDFVAGPVTDETPVVIVNSHRALTITSMPGFIILFQ